MEIYCFHAATMRQLWCGDWGKHHAKRPLFAGIKTLCGAGLGLPVLDV